MKYKYIGHSVAIVCTPAGSTPFDNRTCREKTGCKKECFKRLKCDWCGKLSTTASMPVIEEITTGTQFQICNECKNGIKEDIEY